jgi:hypothetical protein
MVVMDSGEFAVPDIGYGLQLLEAAGGGRGDASATRSSRRQSAWLGRRRRRRSPIRVDGDVFTPAARPAGPPWRLLHVANLNPVKDQPTLLEASGNSSIMPRSPRHRRHTLDAP